MLSMKKIIESAKEQIATEIRVDVAADSAKVFFRINGDLKAQECGAFDDVAKMCISLFEANSPEKFDATKTQTASIPESAELPAKIRLQTKPLPGEGGFSMYMRMLYQSNDCQNVELNTLGYSAEQVAVLRDSSASETKVFPGFATTIKNAE